MKVLPHGWSGILRAGFELACIAIAVTVALVIFPRQTRAVLSQTRQHFWPCSAPLTYRVGFIDPRFGLSTSSVVSLLAHAADQWNSAANKTVLAADQANGIVEVDFVYDSRQQTASTMNSIQSSVSDDKSAYAGLTSQYERQKTAFESERASYDADEATFQADVQSYQEEVTTWNRRGGAPADVYAQLQSQKAQLDAQQSALSKRVTQVNADASGLNALAAQINALIDSLNLKVAKYNAVGAASPGEFEEGLFTSSAGSETIDIYEYATQVQLHRVLAHEFGHALGLEHVDDSDAIMYKLNESANERLTSADIQELDRACKL